MKQYSVVAKSAHENTLWNTEKIKSTPNIQDLDELVSHRRVLRHSYFY